MDEHRRLGDKWCEGDVEVARSLAVPVGQDKVPSLKCSVTSTPLQGSRQRPLSAPLRGSLHKAPGFAGGYLLFPTTPASSRASRAAAAWGALRFIGQPFGMIHRPVSRDVTSNTSVREALLCRNGNAAYWTRSAGVRFVGLTMAPRQTPPYCPFWGDS